MIDPKRLYGVDFVLWSKDQAEALRDAARGGSNRPLDWANLAGEIDDLDTSQRSMLAIGDLQRHGEADGLDLTRIRGLSYTKEPVLGDWFPPEPRG